MVTAYKFKTNSKGIRALLTSDKVMADLLRRANSAAAAARGRTSMPIVVEASPSKERARVEITIASRRGAAEEAKKGVLRSSIDSMR